MKRKKWLVPTAIILTVCMILVFLFLQQPQTQVMGSNYSVKETLYQTSGESTPAYAYCVSADYYLYTRPEESSAYSCIGKLVPYTLTNGELEDYTAADRFWAGSKIYAEITDSYILRLEKDYFYLVFQTRSGKTYLGYGWEDMGERSEGASDDTGLYWLCLLQSGMQEGIYASGFFQRSLINTIGTDVDTFHYWTHEKEHPGYAVVAFQAGESMQYLGFAVFHTLDYTGYTLIDWHVYKNASLAKNGIYACPDPAVLCVDGVATDDNSFDVILTDNKNLDRIVREYYTEERISFTTQEVIGGVAPQMALFSWAEGEHSESTITYYYTLDGSLIEDTGN